MHRYVRLFLFLVCTIQIIFALGYIFQWPFAIRWWPLPYTNDLTFLFIGSIFAASAASTLWCLLSGEYGAFAGISLNYIAIFLPAAIYAYQISGRSSALRTFSVLALIGAVFGLAMLWWSLRIPIRDPRPMPKLVRWSFVIFVIALVIFGGAMVLKTSKLLPWDVTISGQVLYGWMFLGAAAYFAYGVARPSWHNAAGQLAGFLAYDIVLIVPFLLLLPAIDPDRLPSLMIYIGVVSLSGLLAIYYLFVNPATRLWRAAI